MIEMERLDRYAAALQGADRGPDADAEYPTWEDILRLYPDDVDAYRAMARAAMTIADEEIAEAAR